MNDKPLNVLYLHCHDAGRYIQPFGHDLKTPALQTLAETGVLFRQAHCANPTCSPSRAALLTGQAAHSAGMFGLAHRGWTLKDYSQTMMSQLRKQGWYTVLTGQQHIANAPFADPADAGYDEVMGITADFDSPVERVEEFLARKQDGPFFLDVGFFAPHRGGETLGDFPRKSEPPDDRYILPPPTLPDTPETRRDASLYAASVQDMDASMGRVLSALEKHGYADNTLVICTTDHGPAFPHMKCRLTDHGTGVFLILRGPEIFRGGKVVDSMASHIDIFPTVFEVLGLEIPDWVQGQSLCPLVRGDRSAEREELFAEVNYHAAREPMRSIRTRRWKLIRRYEPYPTTVLPNIDNCISKTLLYDQGLRDREEPELRLYDLLYDPQESHNLANRPEVAEVQSDLEQRLQQWMEKTQDPLLNNGELPVCEGMWLTDQSLYSPAGDVEDDRKKLPWGDALQDRNKQEIQG